MTSTFTLNPLLRNSLGSRQWDDLLESLTRGQETENYPPYNIEQYDQDHYGIAMAVVGFSEADIHITVQGDRVTVTGRKESKDEEKVEYLYRSIASRPFERIFRLADHMKVMGAEIKDGLLRLDLVREIPEKEKPRTIQIKKASGPQTIEHASSEDDSKKAA